MFLPAVGHKLHADANAEERPALADHGLLKRVFHARKRAQRRRALAERAHSGKDDAVCGSHLFRCAGGHHIDGARHGGDGKRVGDRSEEHTSELQSLMRISYAVFCLKNKKQKSITKTTYAHRKQMTNLTT